MTMKRLLLLSNSKMAGERYLDYPKHDIREFLGTAPVRALFIPFAAVTIPWDDYESRVKERFNEIGHDVVSIHKLTDAVKAVDERSHIGEAAMLVA
jgi:dipeptidase E